MIIELAYFWVKGLRVWVKCSVGTVKCKAFVSKGIEIDVIMQLDATSAVPNVEI